MSNQQNNQQMQIVDFFEHPITIGDYVAEAYQAGLRIGKVLKINEKSLTLSCERGKVWRTTQAIVTGSHNCLDSAIKDIKKYNGTRPQRLFTWNTINDNKCQHNLINLTALNLLSDEIIENWV